MLYFVNNFNTQKNYKNRIGFNYNVDYTYFFKTKIFFQILIFSFKYIKIFRKNCKKFMWREVEKFKLYVNELERYIIL